MSEYGWYRLFYFIFASVYRLFYRVRISGCRELPEGAAVVCGNHSNLFDFGLMALAAGRKNHLHFMAKIELLHTPIVGWVIRKAGSFGVDRENSDVSAVRSCMKYLKNGEKIGIFPEGTRSAEADYVAAKRGAVVFAARCAAPIVPVYIQRNKRLFHRLNVVVGEPYMVDLPVRGATNEQTVQEAAKLMKRIEALGDRDKNET